MSLSRVNGGATRSLRQTDPATDLIDSLAVAAEEHLGESNRQLSRQGRVLHLHGFRLGWPSELEMNEVLILRQIEPQVP